MDPYEYVATYGRGCLEFVKEELSQLNIEIINDKVEGKIHFKTTLRPYLLRKKLKIVERVFLSVYFNTQISDLNEKELFKIILPISLEKEIPELLNELEEHDLLDVKRLKTTTTYRLNFKFRGKWKKNFRKIESPLRKHFIDKLTIKTYEIDLNDPNIEIVLHLNDECLMIGLPISKQPLSKRSYIKHIGLRSTICSIMLKLASLESNDNQFKLIIDPFCGKGTIISEYLASCKNLTQYFLLSDCCSSQIGFCVENIESNKRSPDMIFSNLTQNSKFPYRDHIADIIITDIPFGKKHQVKHFKSINIFYDKLLMEFERVLTFDNPTVVLLINTIDAEIFEKSLSYSVFKIYSSHNVSLGETNGKIYKLIKINNFS